MSLVKTLLVNPSNPGIARLLGIEREQLTPSVKTDTKNCESSKSKTKKKTSIPNQLLIQENTLLKSQCEFI
jgi:hypothetical protein